MKKLLTKIFGIYILSVLTYQIAISKSFEDDFPSVRGAKNEKELSQFLFNAIKFNDITLLNDYLPATAELDYLKSTSTEKNKPLFENLTADKITTRNRDNFNYITQQGINKGINWSTIELTDYQTRSCDIENIGCNVIFTIQDASGKTMKFSYNAIKVKNNWFVFPGVKIES